MQVTFTGSLWGVGGLNSNESKDGCGFALPDVARLEELGRVGVELVEEERDEGGRLSGEAFGKERCDRVTSGLE